MKSLPYLATAGSDRGGLHPGTPVSVPPEVKSNGKRRTHVKSRSGCRRCKSRRVKCDERQPACGACTKRQELCVYESERTLTPPSASPSVSPLAETTRTRELALFHHWTAITCESFSTEENRQDMRVAIPQLALTHDYLLNAVFAITAAHLAYLNPENAQEHILLALQFHSISLSSFRPTLATISPSESPALVHCSVLLGIMTLVLQSVDKSLGASPIDTLCQLSNMWRGTASIRDLAGLGIYGANSDRASKTPTTSELQSPAVGPMSQRAAFFDRLMEAAVDHPDEAAAQHYTEALRLLKPNIHWADRGNSAEALRWVPVIPAETLAMMQRRDSLAVAITLLFCALMKGSNEFWWIGSFASDLLRELGQIIPADHPSLEPELQWISETWSGD